MSQNSVICMKWHGGEQSIEIGIGKRELYAAMIMANFMSKEGPGISEKKMDEAAYKAVLGAEKLAESLEVKG